MNIFGESETPQQRMKEYQRGIKKSVREIDRELSTLERQEKKLMADIKKEAKEGRMESAKVMAKDLVRTRGYIKKMFKMKSHMEAISLRLTTMQSSAQMAQSMKGITKIMSRMNGKMNLPQIQKIMMEFEKQEDNVLGSILAELGVEATSGLSATPSAPMAQAAGTSEAQPAAAAAASGGGEGGGGDDLDAELQKRLDNLRRT